MEVVNYFTNLPFPIFAKNIFSYFTNCEKLHKLGLPFIYQTPFIGKIFYCCQHLPMTLVGKFCQGLGQVGSMAWSVLACQTTDEQRNDDMMYVYVSVYICICMYVCKRIQQVIYGNNVPLLVWLVLSRNGHLLVKFTNCANIYHIFFW